MSTPPTTPAMTPILALRAAKGQKVQIPRAQIEKLLATDKAPFFNVYVQVQFILTDEKGNPVLDETKSERTVKVATVDKGVVGLFIGVIH